MVEVAIRARQANQPSRLGSAVTLLRRLDRRGRPLLLSRPSAVKIRLPVARSRPAKPRPGRRESRAMDRTNPPAGASRPGAINRVIDGAGCHQDSVIIRVSVQEGGLPPEKLHVNGPNRMSSGSHS